MDTIDPLFSIPVGISSRHGDRALISALTKELAARHAKTLVDIHNIIPFVRWSEEELLSDQIGSRLFTLKWQLSILLTNSAAEPIGFLVSYLRPADQNFDQPSVYMHRMAIIPDLQRRGLGRNAIAKYLRKVFCNIRVEYVTLQANDNDQNIPIINLYMDLGFRKVKRVFYTDKTDWLMVCSRPSDLTYSTERPR